MLYEVITLSGIGIFLANYILSRTVRGTMSNFIGIGYENEHKGRFLQRYPG